MKKERKKADVWYLHQNWTRDERFRKIWHIVREWHYEGAPFGEPCDETLAMGDLLKFFDVLTQCGPDNYLNTNGSRGWYYSFLMNLIPVQRALRNKKYALACHEIQTLAAYEPILQERIYYNLLFLCDKYVINEMLDKQGKTCYSEYRIFREGAPMKLSDKKPGWFTKNIKNHREVTESTALSETKNAFNEIMNTAKSWIKNKSPKEQLLILDYLIDVTLEDVCSSTVAEVLRKPHSDILPECIPLSCKDEHGKKVEIITGDKISIDLSQIKVYVCPWEKSRIPKNLLLLSREPFKYDPDNHNSYFYADINLCKICNGNHSTHIANYLKKGTIESDICDISLLYPHCKTDGLMWYNAHTNEDISEVYDFRIAAAYSIAQLRNSVRTGMLSKHR